MNDLCALQNALFGMFNSFGRAQNFSYVFSLYYIILGGCKRLDIFYNCTQSFSTRSSPSSALFSKTRIAPLTPRDRPGRLPLSLG